MHVPLDRYTIVYMIFHSIGHILFPITKFRLYYVFFFVFKRGFSAVWLTSSKDMSVNV